MEGFNVYNRQSGLIGLCHVSAGERARSVPAGGPVLTPAGLQFQRRVVVGRLVRAATTQVATEPATFTTPTGPARAVVNAGPICQVQCLVLSPISAPPPLRSK